MSKLILPSSIALSLLAFALLAKWYLWPVLSAMPRFDALRPLLLLHSFRHVGLAFLVPGVTQQTLDPRFAYPAAGGDLLTALLALGAVVLLRAGRRSAIPLVWLCNVVGTFDLLGALLQGFRHVPAGHLGAAYFIPAVLVPALLVSHGLMFLLLLDRRGPAGAPSPRPDARSFSLPGYRR